MRGAGWLVLVAVAGAGALTAGFAGAQHGVPTVAVTASATSVSVQASGAVAAGPTRFQVTRQGNDDLSVYFALLNPGVTVDEFLSSLGATIAVAGTRRWAWSRSRQRLALGAQERRGRSPSR